MAERPVDIQIRGDKELQDRLGKMETIWNREQLDATEEAGDFVLEGLPSYPVEPPGSLYVRMGTLGKTLNRKAEVQGTKIIGTIGSNIVYSPYVISDTEQSDAGPQTGFHRAHGWWTLQNQIEGMKNGIIKVYKSALKRMKKDSD